MRYDFAQRARLAQAQHSHLGVISLHEAGVFQYPLLSAHTITCQSSCFNTKSQKLHSHPLARLSKENDPLDPIRLEQNRTKPSDAALRQRWCVGRLLYHDSLGQWTDTSAKYKVSKPPFGKLDEARTHDHNTEEIVFSYDFPI
jgi:hypothetical protein